MTDFQQFLSDLDKKLWTAADKLRANLDAAVYRHAVLGLILLEYVSDSFEAPHGYVLTLGRYVGAEEQTSDFNRFIEDLRKKQPPEEDAEA